MSPAFAGLEVLGFPTGGESLSITAGVVSRIEVGGYAHRLAELPKKSVFFDVPSQT